MKRQRGPGRPAGGMPTLTEEAILTTALALLEEGGLESVSMRALARTLSVDPMALYHYFPDKDALLAAAAEWAYATLKPRAPRGDWKTKLRALAKAYLRFLERSGALLRYVTARQAVASTSARHFDVLFDEALAGVRLGPRQRTASRDAFVDLLHGHSLGGAGVPAGRLDAELDLLLAGIAVMGRPPGKRRP